MASLKWYLAYLTSVGAKFWDFGVQAVLQEAPGKEPPGVKRSRKRRDWLHRLWLSPGPRCWAPSSRGIATSSILSHPKLGTPWIIVTYLHGCKWSVGGSINPDPSRPGLFRTPPNPQIDHGRCSLREPRWIRRSQDF